MEQREREAIIKLTYVVEAVSADIGDIKKGLLDVHGRLEKLERITKRSNQSENQ